jgi:hypothetical protein
LLSTFLKKSECKKELINTKIQIKRPASTTQKMKAFQKKMKNPAKKTLKRTKVMKKRNKLKNRLT